MTSEARRTLESLKQKLRRASIAQVGGFRPPDSPVTSWFGKGVCKPGEGLPTYEGKPLFPLLQINVSELPYVPSELEEVALLVLFQQQDEHPFDKPHGEGWLIREYLTLDNLQPLPQNSALPLKPFPVKWHLINDDAPGWEDAWDIVDLANINNDEEASDAFFRDFNSYGQTKVGGYPCEIQHGVGIKDFVFQVGSEEKAQWIWADNGIGYFFRNSSGGWRWSCQFY